MNAKQNIMAALENETPATTPLSIYDWNMGAISTADVAAKMAQGDWKRLIDRGLSVIHHCEILQALEHDVETVVEETVENGETIRVERKITPVGEVRKAVRGGWHLEEWIKEPRDYLTWKWIVEHTEIVPHYERFAAAEAAVGDKGIVILTGSGNWTHRTPAMKINVDIAGTQQFCMDVAMEVPEMMELYGALHKQFLREQELLAAAPGRYVKWLENLTISMLGPQRYGELLLPVYREGAPILHRAGKRVMVHYDGALNVIADQIAEAPFDMIESLTEPPEGDMTYDACRAAWPDLVFWANINVGLYDQPHDVLRQAVRDKIRRAGRRGLAFEISESLPATWKETIPVILDVLAE